MTITITDFAGLQAINDDLTEDYVLGNDIDASGESFTIIDGIFSGILDGGEYKVKNLSMTVSGSGTQYGALFKESTGIIQNLHLADCAISVTSTDADAYAGGIILWHEGGTIQKCSVTGTIAATGDRWAYASGFAHSIAGTSTTTTKCFSTATVTATSNTSIARASGFAYKTAEPISNCYARGDATATTTSGTARAAGFIDTNTDTITKCYSTGAPTGADGIGGFCRSNSGTITDCFWDTETSGTETSDGGTGKTTALMQTTSTFSAADWDICTIWNRNDALNDKYPYLRWTAADGGSETRSYTLPPVYDDKGRVPSGAAVKAYRDDTGAWVETEYLNKSGQATFSDLPNDTGISFYINWGGTTGTGKSELLFSMVAGVSEGGTGSSDAYGARSNLGLGSEDSPQFTAIELGHASDTTIARDAAGIVSIEGKRITRMAAQVIAANDSYIKTQADAVCDGVDD